MTSKEKRKGDDFERHVLDFLQQAGLEGKRTLLAPQAGQSKEDQPGDLVFTSFPKSVECKARRNGFKQIYDWIENVDMLAIKRDRSPTIVCLRLADYVQLVRGEFYE